MLGQALTAAAYTVDSRLVHSLHAYFLRAGDIHAPIIYDVDRARDGRSFTSRRVVAIQHGRPIFNLAASRELLAGSPTPAAARPLVAPSSLRPILFGESLDDCPAECGEVGWHA